MAEATVEIPTAPDAYLVWRILNHFPLIGSVPAWYECGGFTELNGMQYHREDPSVFALEKPSGNLIILTRFQTPARRMINQAAGMIYLFEEEEGAGRFLYKIGFNAGEYGENIEKIRQGLSVELQPSPDLTEIEVKGIDTVLFNEKKRVQVGGQP